MTLDNLAVNYTDGNETKSCGNCLFLGESLTDGALCDYYDKTTARSKLCGLWLKQEEKKEEKEAVNYELF